jgi:hypothetical protein
MNTRHVSRMLVVTPPLVVAMLLAVAVPTLAQGQAGTTLSATKTAAGYWEREFTWTIDKSVSPATLSLPCGGSGKASYTITLVKSDPVDRVWVAGEICVTNGGAAATENLTLVDTVEYKTGSGKFQPLTGASVTITPGELGPGESRCSPYRISFTPVAGAAYRNAVQVTITNHSGQLGKPFGPNPKADFSLPGSPTLINDTVNVEDSNGGSWQFNASGSASYDQSFACPADAGVHTNTATIRETGQSDGASVQVTCEPCAVAQWCSPGYWKQNHHLGSWVATGISPNAPYNDYFDPDLEGNPTLLYVLENPNSYGGELTNMIADLLSGAHPDVNFTGERVDNCPLGRNEG